MELQRNLVVISVITTVYGCEWPKLQNQNKGKLLEKQTISKETEVQLS
jgi:hypothetical protein